MTRRSPPAGPWPGPRPTATGWCSSSPPAVSCGEVAPGVLARAKTSRPAGPRRWTRAGEVLGVAAHRVPRLRRFGHGRRGDEHRAGRLRRRRPRGGRGPAGGDPARRRTPRSSPSTTRTATTATPTTSRCTTWGCGPRARRNTARLRSHDQPRSPPRNDAGPSRGELRRDRRCARPRRLQHRRPGSVITTTSTSRDFVTHKRAAMRAHASQIPEESFFLQLAGRRVPRRVRQEWFIRAGATAHRRGHGSSP